MARGSGIAAWGKWGIASPIMLRRLGNATSILGMTDNFTWVDGITQLHESDKAPGTRAIKTRRRNYGLSKTS